jgi:hypothetical protein
MATRYPNRPGRRVRNRQSAGLAALEYTVRTADKAVTGLARWATTDHLGSAQKFANIRWTGFRDTLEQIVVVIIVQLVGAVVCGLSAFLLIAYGIPFLISGTFR